MNEPEEQSECVKFCCKLGKKFTETFQVLNQAYGEERMSRTQCCEWFKRFKEGCKMSNKVFIAKVRSFFEHALYVSDVRMRSETAELRENVKMSLHFKYKLHLSSVFIRRQNVA